MDTLLTILIAIFIWIFISTKAQKVSVKQALFEVALLTSILSLLTVLFSDK